MRRAIWLLAAAILFAGAPAQALTVDDVIGLARAGAGDSIILSKIEADGTVFQLTVAEILQLKDAGVSDSVITFMINTGKGDGQAGSVGEAEAVPEAVPEAEYESDAGTGEYATDLDAQYRGHLDVTFGYYYPHWPGFRWSYYYDPFYWPSWSYYYAYCSPYPYWYWYSSPWFGCYGSSYGYYRQHHYRYGYYYYDSPHYADHYKRGGRHIGGQGGAVAERIYKGPRPGGDAERGRLEKTKREFGYDRPAPKPGVSPVAPGTRVDKPNVDGRRYGSPGRVERPSTTMKPSPSRPNPGVRPAEPVKPGKPAVKPAPTPAPRRNDVAPAKPPAKKEYAQPPRQSASPRPNPPAPRPSAPKPAPAPGKSPKEKGKG